MATTPEDSDKNESTERREIPPQQREKARKRDNYRCQFGNKKGLRAGGSVPLEVHHKSYDPENCDLHDLENLITLCRHCHSHLHNKPTVDNVEARIDEKAAVELLPVDFEVIELLEENGPLTTQEIAEQISQERSLQSLEARLWRTMGIDTVVSSQPQLIDQDADSGKWGLPSQITTSKRRIPDDKYAIIQRTFDSLVNDALARGCDRETVAEIFGLHFRTTYRIQYRAQAYNFPIGSFIGQGRPRKSSYEDDRLSAAEAADESETQQHLDDLDDAGVDADGDDDAAAATETNDDSAPVNADGGFTEPEAEPSSEDDDEGDAGGDGDVYTNAGADDGETVDAGTDTEDDNDGVDAEDDGTADGDGLNEYEPTDPMQPKIDGSNREWLITAAEFPEKLRPTIERLNITKIQHREQGQLPDNSLDEE